MKLGKIGKWGVFFKSSLKKDKDFYNEFQLSVTWDNCWSMSGNEIIRRRYFILEIACRRIFELVFEKSEELQA